MLLVVEAHSPAALVTSEGHGLRHIRCFRLALDEQDPALPGAIPAQFHRRRAIEAAPYDIRLALAYLAKSGLALHSRTGVIAGAGQHRIRPSRNRLERRFRDADRQREVARLVSACGGAVEEDADRVDAVVRQQAVETIVKRLSPGHRGTFRVRRQQIEIVGAIAALEAHRHSLAGAGKHLIVDVAVADDAVADHRRALAFGEVHRLDDALVVRSGRCGLLRRPLVDAAIGHQREVELAVLEQVGTHMGEVARNALIEVRRRAQGTRCVDRTKADRSGGAIARRRQLVVPRSTVAVETKANPAVALIYLSGAGEYGVMHLVIKLC